MVYEYYVQNKDFDLTQRFEKIAYLAKDNDLLFINKFVHANPENDPRLYRAMLSVNSSKQISPTLVKMIETQTGFRFVGANFSDPCGYIFFRAVY